MRLARVLPLLPLALSCSVRQPTQSAPRPAVIRHSDWEQAPPLGYAADATRRNKPAGDSLSFRDVTVTVAGTHVDSSGAAPVEMARLRLRAGAVVDERTVREGAAFRWNGYRVAIVAIHGPGELGAGLVAMEIATLASLPAHIAASDSAGGAAMRLRIPHRITHVTLHHTGDARTLEPHEDPAVRLRNLQAWGARDRNWWDVPYHYLLGRDGQVYEGRDHRYVGETNTTYNPEGHFLISIIGNYERQEPTQALVESIADMMAWAVTEFGVPLDRIGGHYNYANSGCPGKHLRVLLEDGTLRGMVERRVRKG